MRCASKAAEARAGQYIAGVECRNIAELGIGLNPKSRLTGGITEVKKRLGTAHMALGDSAAGYGGKVTSDVHLDGMSSMRASRSTGRCRGERRVRCEGARAVRAPIAEIRRGYGA
jgi:leucyl aminopeptidase (aminopeptidase T)